MWRGKKQGTRSAKTKRSMQFEVLENRQLLSTVTTQFPQTDLAATVGPAPPCGLIAQQIAPVEITQGTTVKIVSLLGDFQVADGSTPGLHFQIAADPDPSLFASPPIVLGPGLLVLRFAPNALGCSQLTVSASDGSGQSADSSLVVNVSASALSNSAPANNPSTGESLAKIGHDSSADDDLSPGSGAVITTLAGNGNGGYSGDGGAAADSELNLPLGVATDPAGDLFIADTSNCVVREVNHSTGLITTVAGEYGLSGYSGDGGQATSAQLGMPFGLAVDNNDLFIADAGNSVIRDVNLSTHIITTIAGNGGWGYSGDGGLATAAELNGPFGLAVDNNDLFIADAGNSVIREVNLSTQIITTVAGDGGWGYSGDDEPATTPS